MLYWLYWGTLTVIGFFGLFVWVIKKNYEGGAVALLGSFVALAIGVAGLAYSMGLANGSVIRIENAVNERIAPIQDSLDILTESLYGEVLLDRKTLYVKDFITLPDTNKYIGLLYDGHTILDYSILIFQFKTQWFTKDGQLKNTSIQVNPSKNRIVEIGPPEDSLLLFIHSFRQDTTLSAYTATVSIRRR